MGQQHSWLAEKGLELWFPKVENSNPAHEDIKKKKKKTKGAN